MRWLENILNTDNSLIHGFPSSVIFLNLAACSFRNENQQLQQTSEGRQKLLDKLIENYEDIDQQRIKTGSVSFS